MKRTFDIVLAATGLLLAAPLMAVIAAAVKLTSPGPVLYWSDRVGRYNQIFRMPKFRSMRTGAPQVATHLLQDSRSYITPLGKLLRKTSLDELPQLWSILVGHMSFVGPRPALFNQADLIELRTRCGVHRLTPGITGWAQINGRDELEIPVKVKFDAHYLRYQSLWFDVKIIALTFVKVLRQEGVKQADEPAQARPVYRRAA
jgi:O-antigen biosynthesis protein WbqP